MLLKNRLLYLSTLTEDFVGVENLAGEADVFPVSPRMRAYDYGLKFIKKTTKIVKCML